GIRCPIDQAVLECRLVREGSQILGALGAQLTTKSPGGLQQTLAYAVIIAHRACLWVGESPLLILCDVDAYTQHHIAVARMASLTPGLAVHGNSARQLRHCRTTQAGKDG